MITSDRDIASEAWRCGSIPVSSEVFYEIVMTEDRFETEEEESKDYSQPSAFRKGNPRMLSKKEKAIRRALSKL